MKLSPEAARYLAGFDPALLTTTEGRRILTRLNPRLFALVYLAHHLADESTGGTISFGEAHLAWYDDMLSWVRPARAAREWRRAYVAPRHSAKTTTWFLIAPLWAAAHEHVRFALAIADNSTLAERHLATFKRELETNELLRLDFPELTAPLMRARGATASDNRHMTQQASGFVFAAAGAGSTVLGIKVGNARPDLIIMDDIEPPAADYSLGQMEKRLDLIRQSILPTNAHARVVIVGTVTMEGSIVHQLVKSVTSTEIAPWITAEKFVCRYMPALIENDDGTERSIWPEKWPIEELQAMRNDRYFAINFQNLPLSADGLMWSASDIVIVEPLPVFPRTFISVDPAVTSKKPTVGQKESDATGIAVLSHDRQTGKVYVREAIPVRLDPRGIRTKVAALLDIYPEVRLIIVEVNQGGDLWREHLGIFPDVAYETVNQSIKKELRAEYLLNGYQRRQVVHVGSQDKLEAELLAFPKGLHDDLVDAVGTGYTWVTGAGTARRGTLRRAVA